MSRNSSDRISACFGRSILIFAKSTFCFGDYESYEVYKMLVRWLLIGRLIVLPTSVFSKNLGLRQLISNYYYGDEILMDFKSSMMVHGVFVSRTIAQEKCLKTMRELWYCIDRRLLQMPALLCL